MRQLIFILSAITILSCSDTTTPVASTEEVPVKIISTVGDDAVAHLFIEGMSCERMCVSKIESTLSKMDGVESTEVDFNADRKVDQCTVRFDEDVLNEQQMIEAVQSIAGGVYKVKSVEILKNTSSSSSMDSRKNGKRRELFSAKEKENTRYKIPNVFDVLRNLGGIR